MRKQDLYIQFKSFGFYSQVAEQHKYSVDQVATVYDWIIRKNIDFLFEKDTIQVNFHNLGKIHFDAKKGANYLYLVGLRIESVVRNLPKYLEGRDIDHQIKLCKSIIRRYEKLLLAMNHYEYKIYKVNEMKCLSEKQYSKSLEKFNKTKLLANEIHKSIQRILESNEEGFKELRQSF
jgi:hypothetical protein